MGRARDTLTAKLALAGIFALAVGLRLAFLDLGSFWADEAFSLKLAALPMLDLVRATASDVHPPLYFVLLRAWMGLMGNSDFAIRCLSVVFDIGGIAGTFFLVKLGLERTVPALIAALLHALSPFAVLYAQEARMYSLMILLSAWSTLFLFLFFRSGKAKFAIGYAVLGELLIYTHIFGVLYWGAAGLWWLGRLIAHRRQGSVSALRSYTWKWFVGVHAAILVLALPWGRVIASQAATAGSRRGAGTWWIPVPPIKGLLGPFYVYCGNSFILLGLALALALVGSAALLKTHWTGRARIIEGVVSSVSDSEDRRSFVWLMWSILLAPLIVSFVVSRMTTPIYVARYLAAGLPAFVVLLAVGLTSLRPRVAQVGAALALLVTSAFAIGSTNYANSFRSPTPFRDAVAFVAARAGPRDALLSLDVFALSLEFYRTRAGTTAGEAIYLPSLAVTTTIDSTAERVWLIQVAGKESPARLEGRGKAVHPRVQDFPFKGLVVVEYGPAAE